VINLPSEHSKFRDATTGAIMHQMTSADSINHPTYFLNSSFLPGNSEIFFVSYRTGTAQLFIAGYPTGEIRQLTGGRAIHPFSPVAHPAGERIFFVRGGGIWWVDRRTRAERHVIEFPDAQLGECSLDPTGEWVCAAIKQGPYNGLAVGHSDGNGWHIIPFPRTIIHPQFHPLEPEWIEFAGDPAPRLHRVKRNGTMMECLYAHNNEEFVVHETFLGKTGDLIFAVWPYSLKRMDWTTRKVSTVTDFNAWHISANKAGTQILCDTNHPDQGIFLIDAATGEKRLVCLSESSNQGSQWKKSSYALTEDFTKARCDERYDNLSWMETHTDTVYGPQWTHPHPAFSTDETLISFASDKTGHPQVYVAELD
jgi:hypothetical protein